MKIGNVYKTKLGSYIILTKVEKDVVHWVSFTHSNELGITRIKTYTEEEECFMMDCGYNPDPECPQCGGTGKYIRTIYGMDDAEYMGESVGEFLESKFKEVFYG